jgi:hypothetical protein
MVNNCASFFQVSEYPSVQQPEVPLFQISNILTYFDFFKAFWIPIRP